MSVVRWLSVCLLGVSLCLSAGGAAAKDRYHTVYKGQRLGSIAKRYNVSVDALCAANGISRKDTIQPGQKLLIPEKGESVEEAAQRAKKSASEKPERAKSDRKAKADRGERAKPERKAPRRKASRRSSSRWIIHTIGKGQRLGSIAKRYNVSVAALAFANDITRTTVIKPGQKLVVPQRDDESGEAARKAREAGRIPGLDASSDRDRSERADRSKGASRKSSRSHRSWKDYRRRPAKRGYVTLIGFAGSWKGYVTSPKGGINPNARKEISKVLDAADLEGGIHPRLIKLLAEVSDAFGGRPIRVVSGHRTQSYAKASRHALGHAIDFSIPGVPNEALRDYLLRYDQVGVGYYPNSSFVHFDVRGSKTYWVDHSGPGEAPRYSYIGKGPNPRSLD